MKKLMAMLLTVLLSGLMATDMEVLGKNQDNPVQNAQDKAYTWHSYTSGNPYATTRTYFERAMYVNAEEFGFDYPVNFGGVQSYLYDAGITSSYRIYDRDGSTLIWQSDDFTTTVVGYEVIQPVAPIVLNDDFYIVHVPWINPADGWGYPRIILDTGDGVQGRNFYGYGATGSWTSRDPFCYMMYVALEQYTGADVNGPSARTVYGLDTFMDYDAKLVLAVTDESAITTLTGAYSLNGVDWINVEMTASKANYYEFTGTVPGQPDGTTGEIAFFMSDDLGNSSQSVNFPMSWSKDNPILSEGFESNFPPLGWTLQTAGAGFIQVADNDPVIHQVHSGGYAAAHMDDSGPQDDWLITPLLSIPATNSTTLTFWQNGYWLNYVGTGYHEVAVSTDKTTWDVIYTGHPPVGNVVGNVWEKLYLSLGAYAGQDVYIGFHYVADYEDQWFIDDVAVLYDYQGPTVVDLVGNEALYPVAGAYLNNDMNLSVTVNDLSGAATVVGHYSFDNWTTTVDLPFVMAKGGDEVWTATIPAESTVMSGLIYFNMTDIGGNASVSDTLSVEFVLDTDSPVMLLVKGTTAFVNSPMNLEITFSDESAITSCSGYFSPTGTGFSMFEMNPTKAHTYVYTGTIAAQTYEIFEGKVYFSIMDAEGNTLTTDQYNVMWVDGQISFIEDFESGTGNWTLTGNWGLETIAYTSASHSLTESPNADYLADEVSSAQWTTPFDLTSYPGAEIIFWTKYDLEDGFDYMYFEGSADGGTTWVRIHTFNGEGIGWHEEKMPLNAFCGLDNVTFRFLFESDGGYETNGMNIDDLALVTYNVDHYAPSIISAPYAPKFYLGALGDMTVNAEILDFSGVLMAGAAYTVDGGAEEVVAGTNTTGNMYEFVIPAQAPGSLVSYKILAVDGSDNANEGESPLYYYVAGDHMIYDSGVVDFYMEVTESEAKAVRITVPGSDESKTIMSGKLAYLLFRNYADATHISENMVVHVWDDVDGKPGTVDLVTPFDVTSEATSSNTSAMTKVDMRSYDLSVHGDFWIGVNAPYGSVFMTMERPSVSGVPAYGRSMDGVWNAGTSSWDWTLVAGDNWHFRAVLDGAYTDIEDEMNMPMVTELAQNYPNPFNPATTINFNLAKDAKVSLVVYDVMGREVANLVSGDMVRGSHKVTFDASRLVSGVYYYNLKAGDVNMTKKMMLIK
jgi:hypothetical protein